jgi:hypothetical protein
MKRHRKETHVMSEVEIGVIIYEPRNAKTLEPRNVRPAWTTWLDPISKKLTNNV